MTDEWTFVISPARKPDDLTTWEGRMAARAHAREDAERVMRQEMEDAARRAEREAHDRSECPDRHIYEGACDVCGQPIRLDFCFTHHGIIDYGIEEIPGGGDALVFTWIRHMDGPLPGCDIYSSRVYRQERPAG